MALICAYYFTYRNMSTVIQRSDTYSTVIIVSSVVLVVMSYIETRKTPRGKYTSGSGSSGIPFNLGSPGFRLRSTQLGNKNSSCTDNFRVYV